jgi:hypothetical protein
VGASVEAAGNGMIRIARFGVVASSASALDATQAHTDAARSPDRTIRRT